MSDTKKGQMTFWNHLEVLRWAFLRIAIAMLVFMITFFFFMPTLFDKFVLAPCRHDFILYQIICQISSKIDVLTNFCDSSFNVPLININLASQFLTHISTSFWFAFIITCPYVIYELWKFVSPALYKYEKRNAGFAFCFGSMMFFIGCAVGYLMVFPLTLRFLAEYQLSAEITNQISINSYMGNFFMLVSVMGLIFELPLISWLLSKMGLITKSFFKKYRRYAIVVLLILSAVITPSGDPFTLSVVFVPLFLLYEISGLFVKKT